MKIIEQFIKSKTNDMSICEDGIFFNDNYVAIIDGCTSKSLNNDSTPPGVIAKNLIIKALKTLKYNLSAEEATNEITNNIHLWYKENNLLDTVIREPNKRVSACAVIYSKEKHQLWFLGDCQALINNHKEIQYPTLIEHYTSSIRSFLIQAELNKGITVEDILKNDSSREKIMPILSQQVFLQNEFGKGPFAYSVFNGFPINKNDLKIVQLKDDEKTIILASDGYPKIKKNLEKTENYLQKIINKDPLLYKDYKATKGVVNNQISYDDRSFIKFTV